MPVFPLAVRGGRRRLVRKALHPPTAGVAGVFRPNHGRDRDRGADAFSPPLQQRPGAMGCVSGSRAATGPSADWGGGRGRKGNSLHHSPGGPCVFKSRSVSLPQTQQQSQTKVKSRKRTNDQSILSVCPVLTWDYDPRQRRPRIPLPSQPSPAPSYRQTICVSPSSLFPFLTINTSHVQGYRRRRQAD